MPHLAAVIPAPKAPFEIKEIETPQPGSHELLIKNEIIAIQPIDAKIAKVAMRPIPYPAIIGSSFGGTITAVGPEVTGFAVGDKVVSAKTAGATENKNSSFQRYVISNAVITTKLPSGASLDTSVRLVGNLATVTALFNANLKLARPDPSAPAQPQGKKILIYGGTSSFGSLSVQYLRQAGYDVVTTTSPRHKAFVSRLGASQVIDHTQDSETTIKALIAAGPYDIVVDAISTAQTIKLLADVLAAQGGGNIYALQPAFSPETLPEGVTRVFQGWSLLLAKEEHSELLKWTFATYFPQALAKDSLIPVPPKKIAGGLAALDHALEVLIKGVSSEKLVVDPWE